MRRLHLPVLAAALLLLACHRPAARTRPQRPRNVILILVDTLRADRLSAYGYARATSPAVDAFAREAVKFDANRTQAPCTFPSVNSILTSRWPAAFLGQPDQKLGIPAGIPSLAEILHQRGFHTVAISASPIVRRSPSRFNPSGGFERGFDVFHEDCVWKPAECVNAAAAEHLKEGPKPLFLYLHFIDPHGPYQPPPGWRRKYATGRPDKAWVRRGDPNPIGDWLYKGKPNPGFTPDDVRYLKDLYDAEISYFDAQFATLQASLRRTGLLDDSIVVFIADHGEEFLEHGDVKHCRNLFDTTLHVPLLVRVPGAAPRIVARPVQSLDVVPTVLDYLGINLGINLGVDAKGQPFEGRSLRGAIEGSEKADAGEIQYGLEGSLRSASDGHFKLIQDLDGDPPLLFDLQTDPGETKNVLTSQRRAYAALHDALTRWLARTEGKGTTDAARAAQEKLRSLGYIE
ncbi:MAG TPA: sulfatase [Thermoanaerobaculia bacterium]|jgi:arylsulfatase A-like enzyme|nr:sulfatase [Thermoanaerobaculia bacterium]